MLPGKKSEMEKSGGWDACFPNQGRATKWQPTSNGSGAIARFARFAWFAEPQNLLTTVPIPRASLILTTIPQQWPFPSLPFSFLSVSCDFHRVFQQCYIPSFMLECGVHLPYPRHRYMAGVLPSTAQINVKVFSRKQYIVTPY